MRNVKPRSASCAATACTGDKVAVGRETDRIARHDAPAVLDDEWHTRAPVASLANEKLGHERAALEHRARRLNATDLDVLVESIDAEADRENRN